ncbi:MAG: hypothetical protein VW548_02635, partial [Methylotenera sp.]
LKIGGKSIKDWAANIEYFANYAIKAGAVFITYSPILKAVAADLESKLAEAALLHCQLADLRSFAHGRHLWLAERPNDCVILALIDPSLEALWSHTTSLIPKPESSLAVNVGGSAPVDLVKGIVSGMYLVSVIAKLLGKDPAKPEVQQFGRDLYYADVNTLVGTPDDKNNFGIHSKARLISTCSYYTCNGSRA